MRTNLTPLRTSIAALLALAVALGGTFTGATPAQAASKNTVTINKLSSKKAPWGGKVTVKPSIKTSGQVEVAKKTLTVKKGKKSVVKDKTSAKLAAGTYKVTQKVTYRTYTIKTETRTVTKQKVGAVGRQGLTLTPVAVTCIATSVIPITADSAEVDALCTSPAFTGQHRIQVPLNRYGEWSGYSSETFDQFKVDVLPSVGVSFDATLWPWDDLMLSYETVEQVDVKVYSKTKTKTKTQTLVIKAGKKPTRVDGTGGYNCPKGYPIKGNADSGIYHVPGNRYYSRTKPEECFATASAARAAGYRAAKV